MNNKIPESIRKKCKKLNIKLTRKVGGKRVYKELSVLKKQIKRNSNSKSKSKSKFGAADASPSIGRLGSNTKTVSHYPEYGPGCHFTQGGRGGPPHSTCDNPGYSRTAHFTDARPYRKFWTSWPEFSEIPYDLRQKLIDIYIRHLDVAHENELRSPGYRGRGPPPSSTRTRLFSPPRR